MQRRRTYVATVVIACGLAVSGVSVAAPDIVAARKNNFKQMGAAQKAIVDELRKDQPNKNVIVGNAARMKGLADELPRWFPRGSGPAPGRQTTAKAEIWSQAQQFSALAQQLRAKTTGLRAAAQTGDTKIIMAQLRNVSTTCRDCHRGFRSSD
jgi:cytochrome c556